MRTRGLELHLLLELCNIRELGHKTRALRFYIILRLTLYIQLLLLLRLSRIVFLQVHKNCFTLSQTLCMFQQVKDAASVQFVV